MTQLYGSCRSAIIVAIGRLEESLRHESPNWRELEALDAAGPLLATVERRMDLAEALATDPLYLARAKLIEALICLEPPTAAETQVETAMVPEPVLVTAPPTASPTGPPASMSAPAIPLAARITPLEALAPADDLTRIRGIDAGTAARLAAVGVQTFRDIAAWTAADVARVNGLLDLGRRLHRENWIEQAALLAMPAPTAPLPEDAAPRAAPEMLSPPLPAAAESETDFDLPGASFEAPLAANNNEPAGTPPNEDADPAIAFEHVTGEALAEPACVAAPPSFDGAAAGPASPPVAEELPEAASDAEFELANGADGADNEAVIEIVVPASRAAPAPPEAASPKAALAHLLEQRRTVRARTSDQRDEAFNEEVECDWSLDVPEAEVVVVVRNAAPGSPPRVPHGAGRDAGLQDAQSRDEAPATGGAPEDDWGREASVEIVNPRRPAHRTWRNAPPPPPPPSPPASRFFKALKGE